MVIVYDTKQVFSSQPNMLLPHLHTSNRCENLFSKLGSFDIRFADQGNLQIRQNKQGWVTVNDELKINRKKFGIVNYTVHYT